MHIRIGYELTYECFQPAPMLLMLNTHPSRAADLIVPDHMVSDPEIPIRQYHDGFGNRCSRILAPSGEIRLSAVGLVSDTGAPDVVATDAQQQPVDALPDEILVFLLSSRYCETDRLSDTAWSLFGETPAGWRRVQAICAYVHRHLSFGYEHACSTRTALEAFREGLGVCRDFAHLAIAFCRGMNIPARYCTGYLGDIGVPPNPAPMDFSAWFEVFLGGTWYTFDARHNTPPHRPRAGRPRRRRGGRCDQHDVNRLVGFSVVTEEVPPG